MEIHNDSNLPTIDYRTVKNLQADLKDLSPKNEGKLLRVLKRRGFKVPLFLWQAEDGFYLLDGHQRQYVMTKHDLHSEAGSYEVPYVLIHAKDVKDAKLQLLEITGQYGTITESGLTNFAIDVDHTLLADVNFDAFNVEKLLTPKSPGAGDGEGDAAPVKRSYTFTAEQADFVDRAIKKIQLNGETGELRGAPAQAAALALIARQYLGE